MDLRTLLCTARLYSIFVERYRDALQSDRKIRCLVYGVCSLVKMLFSFLVWFVWACSLLFTVLITIWIALFLKFKNEKCL